LLINSHKPQTNHHKFLLSLHLFCYISVNSLNFGNPRFTMHFSDIFLSVAAFAACVAPVFSAPVTEPNAETTSLVARGGSFAAPAEKCHTEVKKKCDDITAKIDAAVSAKIDADVAVAVVADIQVIADLIAKLGVDLTATAKAGALASADVKACATAVIAIVNLCASVLVKVHASLLAKVSLSVFAAVLLKLGAAVKVLVDLLVSVCLGKVGGLLAVDLLLLVDIVAKLTACLGVFVSACLTLGVTL